MKIRGNKGDAETPFLASYFLPNKAITKVIAQNPAKISKIAYKNLTCDSPFTIVIHFTTNTYKLFKYNTKL